jgi:hypothetical protein
VSIVSKIQGAKNSSCETLLGFIDRLYDGKITGTKVDHLHAKQLGEPRVPEIQQASRPLDRRQGKTNHLNPLP